MKQILFLTTFLLMTIAAHAQGYYSSRHLTQEQIERVQAVKELLGGADKESFQETIKILEKSRHPQLNIEMKEAMAKAFVDIVNEENVEGQSKKEWLYSMVCLNMAYLQFSGTKTTGSGVSDLNKLIRQKLIKYLPANIADQPGFVYSL